MLQKSLPYVNDTEYKDSRKESNILRNEPFAL